jgi:hypothetical protein
MEVVFVKKKSVFLKNCEQEKNWSVHLWVDRAKDYCLFF